MEALGSGNVSTRDKVVFLYPLQSCQNQIVKTIFIDLNENKFTYEWNVASEN